MEKIQTTNHCRFYCLPPNEENLINSVERHIILNNMKGISGPVILAYQNSWTITNKNVLASIRYTHKSLHIIHGAQMVPNHFGGNLPSNILTEFISDTNHVEMAIHTWGKDLSAINTTNRSTVPQNAKKPILSLQGNGTLGERHMAARAWYFPLHYRRCSGEGLRLPHGVTPPHGAADRALTEAVWKPTEGQRKAAGGERRRRRGPRRAGSVSPGGAAEAGTALRPPQAPPRSGEAPGPRAGSRGGSGPGRPLGAAPQRARAAPPSPRSGPGARFSSPGSAATRGRGSGAACSHLRACGPAWRGRGKPPLQGSTPPPPPPPAHRVPERRPLPPRRLQRRQRPPRRSPARRRAAAASPQRPPSRPPPRPWPRRRPQRLLPAGRRGWRAAGRGEAGRRGTALSGLAAAAGGGFGGGGGAVYLR